MMSQSAWLKLDEKWEVWEFTVEDLGDWGRLQSRVRFSLRQWETIGGFQSWSDWGDPFNKFTHWSEPCFKKLFIKFRAICSGFYQPSFVASQIGCDSFNSFWIFLWSFGWLVLSCLPSSMLWNGQLVSWSTAPDL